MIPDRLFHVLPPLLQSHKISGQWSIEKLLGDASNRTYYRLATDRRTYVVMLLAEGFNSLAEQNTKTSRKITELPYIDLQRYFSKRKVRVPKLVAYNAEHGVLILEDFGDRLLLEVVHEDDQRKIQRLYENALDQLERLAVIPVRDPRTSIAFARAFDRDLYNWEFMHFVEYALDQRLHHPPSVEERKKIVAELFKLTEMYLRWEKLIVHRDYHSRNLMVLGPKKLGVLDFQDALLGPLYYDLASLLRDSYAKLDPKLQDQLVERYRKQMKRRRFQGTSSREEFRRAFDLMGLHRNLKAVGRFCYIDQVKSNPRYLADVPRTLGYVRETLNRYRELKQLKNVLGPYLEAIDHSCE